MSGRVRGPLGGKAAFWTGALEPVEPSVSDRASDDDDGLGARTVQVDCLGGWVGEGIPLGV